MTLVCCSPESNLVPHNLEADTLPTALSRPVCHCGSLIIYHYFQSMVQTLIRLLIKFIQLLEEQLDHDLQYLPFHWHLLETFFYSKGTYRNIIYLFIYIFFLGGGGGN